MSDLFAPEIASDRWSLTARLGQMLVAAEKQFGERYKEFAILGVEFRTNGPYTWQMKEGGKHVIPVLHTDCLSNKERALYQLSHEVVHCLYPTSFSGVTVIEEGCAVIFQEWYMKEVIHKPWHGSDERYINAKNLVAQLLEIDYNIVSKLRDGRAFADITPKEIIKISDKKIKKKVAEELCSKFNKE
jgi:hypothetical protein